MEGKRVRLKDVKEGDWIRCVYNMEPKEWRCVESIREFSRGTWEETWVLLLRNSRKHTTSVSYMIHRAPPFFIR